MFKKETFIKGFNGQVSIVTLSFDQINLTDDLDSPKIFQCYSSETSFADDFDIDKVGRIGGHDTERGKDRDPSIILFFTSGEKVTILHVVHHSDAVFFILFIIVGDFFDSHVLDQAMSLFFAFSAILEK